MVFNSTAITNESDIYVMKRFRILRFKIIIIKLMNMEETAEKVTNVDGT
jgi:hypothetical protein